MQTTSWDSRTLTGAMVYSVVRRLRSLRSLADGYEWSRPAGGCRCAA
ncbi:MAG: hypothetical protein IKP58_02945 [Victivallales bacterium]|nr:hypothetical protein [Victivallales bacterium]